MKKSTIAYIHPRESRGLLKDAINGLLAYNYARNRSDANVMYPEEKPKRYKITVTVEQVKSKSS